VAKGFQVGGRKAHIAKPVQLQKAREDKGETSKIARKMNLTIQMIKSPNSP
jgi:hypothetical protein